jgi:hypothetical protein
VKCDFRISPDSKCIRGPHEYCAAVLATLSVRHSLDQTVHLASADRQPRVGFHCCNSPDNER